MRTLTLVVDPTPRPGELELVTEDGAFATAMRALTARSATRAIPDRVLLELYAYELVERMREQLAHGAESAVWNAPFWPVACAAAADLDAHALHELAAMWPAELRVVRRSVAPHAVAARMSRVFGIPVFDEARYAAHALDDDGAADAVRVVGLVLARSDGLLLEWRPASARVYAARWDTPGGKLEPGESAWDAAVREAREELGVEVVGVRPLAVAFETDPTSGGPFVHHVFAVTEWRGEPTPVEGQALAWRPRASLWSTGEVHHLVHHIVP